MAPESGYNSKVTPKNSRQIRNYGKNKSPSTYRRYNTIAKGYTNLEIELATKNNKIAALEAEVAKLTQARKRKTIPTPNKRFMLLSKVLAANNPVPVNGEAIEDPGVEKEVIEVDEAIENDEAEENEKEPTIHQTVTAVSVDTLYNLTLSERASSFRF
jgi:hypothetical protein